jgi:methionine sulfoxide reductase catalytic subunit
MLFYTEQWRRLVPTSPVVLLQAWNTWMHYATFHLPPEPNGFYGYNALQQIAYFVAVFVFGVLAILTGIAMSPAVVNRFPWYARIFGGRQAARSIHFLTMLESIPSEKLLGEGEGGKNEDDEYFDLLPNI